MDKFLLLVGLLLVIPCGFASEGFTGLPSSITGGGVGSVDALGDVDKKVKSGVRYTRETTSQNFDIVKPAPEKNIVKPAPVDGSNTRAPRELNDGPVVSDMGDDYVQSEDEHDGVEVNAFESTQIEFDIPEGYSVVDKNSFGLARINGDNIGTYIIKVPSLLYTRIELPFAPEIETPFPEQVVIKQKDDVVLVAPRGVVPVNLILYHPERPTVSVSLVLLPVSSEIPATIKVSFNASRIPEAKKDQEKTGDVLGDYRVSTMTNLNSNKVSMYDRVASHADLMGKINTDIANGFVPDGYSLKMITEGPTGALCGDKRLLGQYVQNIVGNDFEVDVFRVRNAADNYVVFDEKSCYRNGVSSVFFNPSSSLAPGVEAELIIVHSRAQEDQSGRARRPTRVTGE